MSKRLVKVRLTKQKKDNIWKASKCGAGGGYYKFQLNGVLYRELNETEELGELLRSIKERKWGLIGHTSSQEETRKNYTPQNIGRTKRRPKRQKT